MNLDLFLSILLSFSAGCYILMGVRLLRGDSEIGGFQLGATFIVVPDIVAGGPDSLSFSLSWLPRLDGVSPLLLAVQDGMTPCEVAPHLSGRHRKFSGLFVGGTTEWKEDSLPVWGEVCHHYGAYLHVGRVNSARRIRLCHLAGADSFDGTSVSMYAVNIHHLDRARNQPTLPLMPIAMVDM